MAFRTKSEIDQIHLSIEAQCGTARLPQGDCHKISHQLNRIISEKCHNTLCIISFKPGKPHDICNFVNLLKETISKYGYLPLHVCSL